MRTRLWRLPHPNYLISHSKSYLPLDPDRFWNLTCIPRLAQEWRFVSKVPIDEPIFGNLAADAVSAEPAVYDSERW